MAREPFFQLDHLDVLESDAGVDGAVDDGFGYVHSAADGGVVVRGHAVVLGEFVDLDLGFVRVCLVDCVAGLGGCAYLAELADVADALAFQRAEVLGDSAGL